MQIDLLYFDGCPSCMDGLENLKAALAAEDMQVNHLFTGGSTTCLKLLQHKPRCKA
jgi:hypothetical protein